MRRPTRNLVGFHVAALVGCASQPTQAPPQAVPSTPTTTSSASAPTSAPSSDSKAAESLPADDAPASPDTLTIFVVDVGHGDSTVVLGPPSKLESEKGRRMALVMDAGGVRPDGGKLVKALLVEQHIQQVDYVVLSNYDTEHLGGFVNVSGTESLIWKSEKCEPTKFFPSYLIDNGDAHESSPSADQWMKCAAQGTAQRLRVTGGRVLGQPLPLGDGYYATIVAGDGYVLGGFGQDEDVDTAKEKSIALLVRGPDDFEFLVTSDLTGQPEGAENARLEPILARGLASHGVDLEILRVGNHGAESATEKTFVETSKPDVAIISTSDGKSNDERPHCKTYETLKAAKVGLVLQTEAGKPVCSPSPVTPVVMNGTVRIDVQGSTYTIRGYGKKSPTNDQATNRAVYECSVKGGCSLSTSGKTPLAKAP